MVAIPSVTFLSWMDVWATLLSVKQPALILAPPGTTRPGPLNDNATKFPGAGGAFYRRGGEWTRDKCKHAQCQ